MASSEPSISVIVPTYDDGYLLEPCLASIAEQTMAAHEVIVVDDGSTNSDALLGLSRALKRFPTVRILRQSNAGPAAARNCGLRECDGDFVVFVDADDRLTPDSLAVKFANFDAAPEVVASFGGFIWVLEDGRRIESSWRDYHAPLQPNLIGKPGGIPGGLPLYMFRTTDLKALGGLDETLKVMEDFDLLIRLGRRGGIFAGSNGPTYIRHLRPQSHSRHSKLRALKGTFRFLSKARKHRYFDRLELSRRYFHALGAFAAAYLKRR